MAITVFTSITANYLPKARVLAGSVKKYHPEMRFVLLLAETAPLPFSADFSDFDAVTLLDDLGIADLSSWLFKHSVVELCTAIKGFFLEQCLQDKNCEAVFYLDPDIAVFSPLTPLLDAFTHASILLTPHLLKAEEKEEDIIVNELSALKHGVYNLGFLGVKNTEEGRQFASWWRERLATFCYADIANGMFTDQRWVDLAPAFFPGVAIIRHEGCNVATWNLSTRYVEGTIENGFTINGEPLIFYHFSGFDSGSQLGMLQRYAHSMPAAFRLRDWYIAACTERETEVETLSWRYNYFSDGSAILSEHRQFYREHKELTSRFPDPFRAGAGSFLDWYNHFAADYSASPLPECGDNPLAHFLNSGWRQALSPHPAFDSVFYLERYPDVKALHSNPLFHYQHTGGNERRDPHPLFDTRFYWRRYRLAILDSGLNPLEYMLTHSEDALSLTCYNAVKDENKVAALQAKLSPDRPVILLISHNQGGGTEKHVYDLARKLKDKAHFLLLYPITDTIVRLADFPGMAGIDLLFDHSTQLDRLVFLLKSLHISRLHIHHIMGNERYLPALIAALKLPYDITLHDYFFLSPHPHLTNADGRFSGEPEHYHEWQEQHLPLIVGANRIIAPSHDIAARHQRFFPDIDCIIAPHPSDATTAMPQPSAPALCEDEPLRIAVLGLVSPNKGSALLDKTAMLAHDMGENITFHLIGTTLTPLESTKNHNLHVHGAYEEEALPTLLQALEPHLVWFPALCPESFSYTLSSALEAALPVAVTNIGAFPERVAGRAWSWIMPWESTAGEWLHFFMMVRKQHFLPEHPPLPPEGTIYTGDSSFYDTCY